MNMLQKVPKAQALREAQIEMLLKYRDFDKFNSQFFWGAFICVGDYGPMNELEVKRNKTHI